MRGRVIGKATDLVCVTLCNTCCLYKETEVTTPVYPQGVVSKGEEELIRTFIERTLHELQTCRS